MQTNIVMETKICKWRPIAPRIIVEMSFIRTLTGVKEETVHLDRLLASSFLAPTANAHFQQGFRHRTGDPSGAGRTLDLRPLESVAPASDTSVEAVY